MTQLRRIRTARRLTLVPLIDVLFILLIYFMVTSVYRDLDMIPLVRTSDNAMSQDVAIAGTTIFMRITADGQVAARGRVVAGTALIALLEDARMSEGRVMILPSGSAPLGALTDLMDAVAQAEVTNVRVIRLEAAE